MRTIVIGLCACLFLGMGAPAYAQSLFERCEKQKTEVQRMQEDVKRAEDEMVRIDKQLSDLLRRQNELRRSKSDKAREKSALLKRIKVEQARQDRMCRPLRECENYDRRVDRLKARMAPVAEKLRAIRDEMRNRREESSRLSSEVEAIENSYSQLKCDDLVPGQTAQTTIDRCSDLFSEWNKLQTGINSLNNWLSSLRDRYQRIMKQMRAYNAELASLLGKMRSACAHSDQLATLESLEKEQHNYRSMKDDIDKFDKRVRHYRALKIKRPKLKPKKGPKPTLKPKKKEKHTLKPVR